MSVLRAIADEVIDVEFMSYLDHRKAEVGYYRLGSFICGDNIVFDFDQFDIISRDMRRIEFVIKAGSISVLVYNIGLPTIDTIDLADPEVCPVETIRTRIRNFLDL